MIAHSRDMQSGFSSHSPNAMANCNNAGLTITDSGRWLGVFGLVDRVGDTLAGTGAELSLLVISPDDFPG